ncbi:MAG: hypothetical protein ABFS42_10120 [Candidatus Krumholzibacteriota bacterium]
MFFLGVICLIYLAHALYYWEWVEDDAFISLRYAQNFVNGSGLVFNPGERVEGYSNLGWVLYASLAIKLGLEPLVVLRITALLAGLAALVLSWRAAGILASKAKMSALFAPLFLALNPMLPRHSTTGLETVPFAALIMAGFVTSTGKPTSTNSGIFLLLLVLLIFMRPEGVVFALLFLLWRHVGSGIGTGPAPKPTSTLMWIEFLAAFVVVTALFAWKWSYYGDPLPNTFYAKMTGEGRAFVEGTHYTLDWLRENGGAILAGLFLANLLNRKFPRAFLFAAVIVAVQAGIVIAAGGDWMHFYRFFVPVMPLLAAGCAAGLGAIILLRQQVSGAQNPVGKWSLIIVLAGTMAAGYVNVYKVERATGRAVMPFVKSGSYLTDGYRQTARWIVDNTPPGASVALCDIGLVGFHSGRRIVDMFGLIDPHISRLDGRQHFKSDPEYVLGKHPDLVVLVASENDEFIRIPDAAMFADPDFSRKYTLVKTIPIRFRNETVRIYRALL